MAILFIRKIPSERWGTYDMTISNVNTYTNRQLSHFNILRPRQNGRHFADDTFKYIFLNENVWNPIKISLKFVPKGPINNIPALVQIMAWRRPGDKPLSEPMVVSLPTHICVARPQWVNIHIVYVHIKPNTSEDDSHIPPGIDREGSTIS